MSASVDRGVARYLAPLLFLLFSCGRPAVPLPVPAAERGQPEPLAGELVVTRFGVREPVLTVALKNAPIDVELEPGVYMATLRRPDHPKWRALEVTEHVTLPRDLDASWDTPWTGTTDAARSLYQFSVGVFETVRDFNASRPTLDGHPRPMNAEDIAAFSALRADALASADASLDARLGALAGYAVLAAFTSKEAPAPVAVVLSRLPPPHDPLVATIPRFFDPAYLAYLRGDESQRATVLAWFDAVASGNPEPGAKAGALHGSMSALQKAGLAVEVHERLEKLERLERLGSTLMGALTLSTFSPDRRARPGNIVPAHSFEGLDRDDPVIRTRALPGPVVLVDFWATWCRGCVEHMPVLHDAYARVHGLDVDDPRRLEPVSDPRVHFVSISLDERTDDVRNFRRTAWTMPWLHAHVGRVDHDALLEGFGLLGLGSLLLDAEGRIIASGDALRGDALLPTLRAALEAQPAP